VGEFEGFEHPIFVEVIGSAAVGLAFWLIESLIGLALRWRLR
jgi:hypothetical protein